jgi:hypothetical protein
MSGTTQKGFDVFYFAKSISFATITLAEPVIIAAEPQ